MSDRREYSGGTLTWNDVDEDSKDVKPTRLYLPEENEQPQQRPIELYFEKAIRRYVLPDIDRLRNEVRPNSDGLRGCSVPLAMLLFAVVDLFGGLMKISKSRQQRENFRYFLSSEYLPVVYTNNWEALYRVFRGGIAHQIFPKACGIAKAGPDKPLIFYQGNIPFLNVDVFSDDVVAALHRIENEIAQEPDSELARRMNVRLQQIQDYDSRQRDACLRQPQVPE